jgi:hypothetical protein
VAAAPDDAAGGDSVEMYSGSALVVVEGRAAVSIGGGGGWQAMTAEQHVPRSHPNATG